MLKAVGILWTLSQVIGVEDVCTYSAWVLVSYVVLQAKCNPPPAPPPSTLQAPQFNTVIRYTMLLATGILSTPQEAIKNANTRSS
jgi:hypothetical protein